MGEAIGTVSPPIEVTYKWPNDVLLQGNKVAGILLESRAAADGELEFLLLGCGVNVAHFPVDLGRTATSMHYEGVPKDVTAADLLEAFGRHFLSRVSRWIDDGFAPVRKTGFAMRPTGEQIECACRLKPCPGVSWIWTTMAVFWRWRR